MAKKNGISILLLAAALTAGIASKSVAQDQGGDVLEPGQAESHSTLLSIKFSGGYGLGRARQSYGVNGSDPVFWSLGQGVKMDGAIDIPLLPVEVINSDGEEFGPEKIPYVGLELELASGYHISTGGTTNDPISGGFMTTNRSYTYIPITLGLNARASFGPGLPSVYIGAGGGVHLQAIYEDDISYSNSSLTATRTYNPPTPFELYGAIGFELPLMYSPEDGNSPIDLFAQVRLTEATDYVYQYTLTNSAGASNVVKLNYNPNDPGSTDAARSASNVAFSVGVKINIY